MNAKLPTAIKRLRFAIEAARTLPRLPGKRGKLNSSLDRLEKTIAEAGELFQEGRKAPTSHLEASEQDQE